MSGRAGDGWGGREWGDGNPRDDDNTGGWGHSCFDKAREIHKITGVSLGSNTHSVVDFLCVKWGCKNADEFYAHMRSLTKDELKAEVKDAVKKVEDKRKKKRLTVEENGIA
jgi:hypothetical protein